MTQLNQQAEETDEVSSNVVYDKSLQRRRYKVLMLVANAGSTDARVRKEAESLQRSGYEVTVACTQPKGTHNEHVNGVYYKRSQLVRGVHLNFWVKILKLHLIKVGLVKFAVAFIALLGAVMFSLLGYGLYLALSALFTQVPNALTYVTSAKIALAVTLLIGVYVLFKVLTHSFVFGGRYQNYLKRRRKKRRKSGTRFKKIKARIRVEMRKRVRLLGTMINYGSISYRHLRSINADKKHYDVIHAHDLNTMIAGVQLSRRMKAKLVFDAHELATHEDDIQHYPVRIFKRVLMRAFIDKPDHIITVSQGFRRRFEDFYRKPKVDVIYNTPKISDESTLGKTVRDDAGLETDDILVVYIGGINRRRGSRQLARSLAYLPENYNFVMVTGGKAEIKNEILDIYRKHKKPGYGARIQFLPPVPATEVVHYCKTADISVITRIPPKIYFNPQREYSMPNKLFESLFSGLPVVVGSSKEVVEFVENNQMGLPADCSKPEQLAKKIVTVYNDRHIYRKTDDQIRELRSRYGWPAQSDKLVDIYDNLLDI